MILLEYMPFFIQLYHYEKQERSFLYSNPVMYLQFLILVLQLFFSNFIAKGSYSEWNNWTSCSVSCSQGVRTRERKYYIPPRHNGSNCQENYVESIVCNKGRCPGITKFKVVLIRCNFNPHLLPF